MTIDIVGRFFFRFRGQIPVFFFASSVLLSFFFENQIVEIQHIHMFYVLAYALMVLGVTFRCFTVGFAKDHSSGRNRHAQVAKNLNTLGAYSMTQHPLYFSNALLWIGAAMMSNQWIILGCSALMCIVIIPIIISEESSFLSKYFGEEYLNWKRQTPSFFPNPLLYKAPKTSFQWIRLFATEYPTWISACCAVFMLQMVSNFQMNGSLIWQSSYYGWIISMGLIALLGRFFKYVVVRKWLKKPI